MTSPHPPLSIGQCAALACLLEAAAPKVGNVHRGADFDDLTFGDFAVSAVAIGPPMEAAAVSGVGRAVLEAVTATWQLVGTNTNLGIVLLVAPLSKCRPGDWQEQLRSILVHEAGAPVSALVPWIADITWEMAAVNVVLPWSTWPIVPTFTCGLLRSKVSLAMAASSHVVRAVRGVRAVRDPKVGVRFVGLAESGWSETVPGRPGRRRTLGAGPSRAPTPRSLRRPRLPPAWPVELVMGIEPMTSSLPRRCSTTELHQRVAAGGLRPVRPARRCGPTGRA